jgi:hypothetical protein
MEISRLKSIMSNRKSNRSSIILDMIILMQTIKDLAINKVKIVKVTMKVEMIEDMIMDMVIVDTNKAAAGKTTITMTNKTTINPIREMRNVILGRS